MAAPSGLGGWIAFRQRIGTVAAAAALAVSLGCSWVAPRAGCGGLNDSAFAHDPAGEIAAYHAAGLKVFPWIYSRPGSWREEVEAIRRLVAAGADGIIIDAEIDWGGHNADAIAFGKALRAAVGDVWIADAPWPWILSHPEYPEREFADFVDARLTQDYWAEINRDGARADVGRQEAEWAKRYADPKRAPGERDPVWPVACTYGRAELVKVGAPPCPGEMVPDDLDWFLDAHPGMPVSLYSLEMLLADTPNGRDCLARLKARALRTIPPPPDTLRSVEVRRADSPNPAPMATAALELEDVT
jgi:hypothetical protein